MKTIVSWIRALIYMVAGAAYFTAPCIAVIVCLLIAYDMLIAPLTGVKIFFPVLVKLLK